MSELDIDREVQPYLKPDYKQILIMVKNRSLSSEGDLVGRVCLTTSNGHLHIGGAHKATEEEKC